MSKIAIRNNFNLYFLLLMIDSLDDEHFGRLIAFIYGINFEEMYNPYYTYRELFMSLIMNNIDNTEYGLQNFNYRKSKIAKNFKAEKRINCYKSKIQIPLGNGEIFYEYILCILFSISFFRIPENVLKNGFNDFIDLIITMKKTYLILCNKQCAILREYILNPIDNQESKIEINKYRIFEKQGENLKLSKDELNFKVKINNCFSVNGKHKPLINSKHSNILPYINKFKSLDLAVNKLKEKEIGLIECQNDKDPKKHICPLCLSKKNIKERTLQYCKICKKLRKLILEIEGKPVKGDKSLKSFNHKIEYLTKKQKETFTSDEEIRKQHYINLKEYVTKLHKVVHKNANKNENINWEEVEQLVNKAFGDIAKFKLDDLNL